MKIEQLTSNEIYLMEIVRYTQTKKVYKETNPYFDKVVTYKPFKPVMAEFAQPFIDQGFEVIFSYDLRTNKLYAISIKTPKGGVTVEQHYNSWGDVDVKYIKSINPSLFKGRKLKNPT